jgi:hypothetical protein
MVFNMRKEVLPLSIRAIPFGYYTDPYDPPVEDGTHLNLLDSRVLTLLSSLINHRRPLPVCRGGIWRCYACSFESPDFDVMTRHIMNAHGPAPFNEEDELEMRQERATTPEQAERWES